MNKWGSSMAQAGIEIKRHLCVPFPHQTTRLQRVEMSPRAPCWEKGKDEVLRAAEGGREFSSSNSLDYVVGRLAKEPRQQWTWWAGPRLGQHQDCFLMSISCSCVRTSEDGLGGPCTPFFVLLSDVATLINLFFFYFHY